MNDECSLCLEPLKDTVDGAPSICFFCCRKHIGCAACVRTYYAFWNGRAPCPVCRAGDEDPSSSSSSPLRHVVAVGQLHGDGNDTGSSDDGSSAEGAVIFMPIAIGSSVLPAATRSRMSIAAAADRPGSPCTPYRALSPDSDDDDERRECCFGDRAPCWACTVVIYLVAVAILFAHLLST